MWSDRLEGDIDGEPQRYMMARLLESRGEKLAAAIMAVSSYEAVIVDNWDGGQYEAVLAVPPEMFDHARSECAEVLARACSDLIGSDHYRGLNITLKCTETPPDWVAPIIAAITPRWVQSVRTDLAELNSAVT